MGWYYRKSLAFGPFRVNLSKSGIGYSVGAAGFRTGVSSAGRKYTSMGIPGTGLRYISKGKGSHHGCLLLLVVAILVIVVVGALILLKGGR